MSSVIYLAHNILRLTYRKKFNIVAIILLPIISLSLSMLIYSNSARILINVAIYDEDRTTITKDLVDFVRQNNQFKTVTFEQDVIENLTNKLISDEIDCILRIPKGFSESLHDQTDMSIELVAIKGKETTAYVEIMLNHYLNNASTDVSTLVERRELSTPDVSSSYPITLTVVGDNYSEKLVTVQGIGFLIMFLMFISGTTAEYILREKRSRTYYRVCAAPVNSLTYIFSNILANLIILLIQIVMALLVVTKLLRLDTHIPFPQLLLVLTLFSFVSIGLGMLVVSFAKDSMHSSTMMNLIITPTCMLGGCMWPLEIAPPIMRKISVLVPQTWALSAVRKLQIGSGWQGAGRELLVLAGFSLVLFTIVGFRFRRRDEIKSFI